MAQEVKYLSYSGLSYFKDILEGRYEKKGHTHTVANITDFGSHVYDATISRTKNTVLAAPNGSNGTASFRALVAADLPTHTHSYLPLSGGVLNIAASTETFNSITTNNDNTSWNVRPGLKIANNNNALVFWTSGVTNERTAYIQSGHNQQAYATALGPLHLNPFGGKVIFGKSVEILNGDVKATSFTGNLTGNVTGNATSLGSGHSATTFRNRLTYLSGQYTNNTTETAGQIYIGSSANWDVISSPKKDGTDAICNIMSMRMAFNYSFWHEIATTPNNNEFYHRSVRSNGASSWRTILDSVNYSNYALPLSGGALTGPITFNLTDADRNIIRINNGTYTDSTVGQHGYTLKYLGSGSGDNNSLALFSDNCSATTQNKAIEIKQSGNIHTRSIIPLVGNTYDLGSSSLKWINVYATTFNGHLNGTVSMTGGDANAYRNILVTNGSNGICYSSLNNVQLNYATGDVKATSFTGKFICASVDKNIRNNCLLLADGSTVDINSIATKGWYSINPYIYTDTDNDGYKEIKHYYTKIATFRKTTDEGGLAINAVLRFRLFEDVNYPSYGEYVLRLNWNHTYGRCVTLVQSSASTRQLEVYVTSESSELIVDDAYHVWVRSDIEWSSSLQFKIEHDQYKYGNIYTSDFEQNTVEPSNIIGSLINNGVLRIADNTTSGTVSIHTKANGDVYKNKFTADTFIGNLTGNVTGNLTGNVTGSLTGNASSASTINIYNSTNSGNYPLTFVSNTNEQNHSLYVSPTNQLTFQPSTGNLTATRFTGSINVKDIRSLTGITSEFAEKAFSPFFSNVNMPSTDWWSGFTSKGWTNDYNSWQLVGISSQNDASTQDLYWRNGRNNTWNTWKKILDTSNTTYTASVTSGTTAAYQIGTLKIGDTDTILYGKNTTYSSLKNPYPIQIQANSTVLGTYDGSATTTVNITAANLGLSTVFDYKGVTTTTLTDGSTTKPIVIGNVSYTQKVGDVVIVNGDTDKEYFWNGSKWEEMGRTVDLSGYSPTTHTHSYLPLSGGTISSSAFCPLVIERSGSTNMAALRFKNSNGILGSIGMNTVYGSLLLHNADGTSNKTILDSSNYNTYAAAKSHTHTKAQITDFPTSLKNPNALTIQGNGTTLTNGVYDGSAAKTVNITPASIGAAASSHTHSYLPLSGGTMTGTINSQSIIPKTTNTYDLGSSSLKWTNVYATTFRGNLSGNVTGNLTGNVTGNAATATKASTVTIAANSADVACELFFQSSGRVGTTGTITYDNDLRYNPSKNTLMMGGMTTSTASPTSANIVLDGTNKKLSLGESYIQYNSSTGCLEIIA